MRSGMWAMMTLLDVLDWSFSDSLVHKFSAPGGGGENAEKSQEEEDFICRGNSKLKIILL